MFKVVFAVASVCLLAGCSSAGNASSNADIAKIVGVKSTFGPEFKVLDISERAIDPKLLSGPKLPDGLKFDPANCAKAAAGPEMPSDMQGNMAAVSAEGNGNRFVVIAVETSKAMPSNDPGKDCNKVAFSVASCEAALRWSMPHRSAAPARWVCIGSCRPSSSEGPAPASCTTTPLSSVTTR